MSLRAEVIIPLALDGTFSYILPQELSERFPNFAIGMRVVVPFGKKRYYTGIVCSLHKEDTQSGLKEIEQVLDEEPLISTNLLKLWQWVAYYYCCPIGSVLREALPSGLLPESKTNYRLEADFCTEEALSPIELEILDYLASLAGKAITVERLEAHLGRRLTRPLLRLVELGAVSSEEALHLRYRPKFTRTLRLVPTLAQDDVALNEAFDQLKRAPRQAELLLRLLQLLKEKHLPIDSPLLRSQLLEAVPKGEAPLRALIDRGILLQEEVPMSRLNPRDGEKITPASLPPFPPLEKSVTLYHGTDLTDKETYLLSQISQVLHEGGQVLYLTPSVYAVPASSLFLHRLERLAGSGFFPYHSLTSEAIRVETFRHLRHTTDPIVVVGTRSAIFAPLPRLRLVIIDEEHEYLYKQQLVAPHYHARDVALWRAHQMGAQVLLSSMTPSAEVSFHALRGKYDLIHPSPAQQLEKAPLILPPLQTIDLAGLRAQKEMPWGYSISPYLYEAIQQTIQQGKKVLLLQNRRGYASAIACEVCEQRIQCPNCDVSLTYHQARHALLCHYCGFIRELPEACPHCGATEHTTKYGELRPALRQIGYGIERVEEEIKKALPQYKTLRIDSETLSSRKRRIDLLQQLEEGNAQILLGTQLIRNQPVWDNLGLIAVVQLDALLGLPDIRNQERVYQLLYQLRLRTASDSEDQLPRFLLQTNDPKSPFIQELQLGRYDHFLDDLLAQREATHYPPFSRMTYVWLRGKDERILAQISLTLSRYLMALLPDERVDGPLTPPISRLEGLYQRQIVIRRPFSQSYQHERTAFASALHQLRLAHPESSRLQIIFDVDPL